MKPAFLTDKDNPWRVWLVDDESSNSLLNPISGNVELHYEKAVDVSRVIPGYWLGKTGTQLDLDVKPLPTSRINWPMAEDECSRATAKPNSSTKTEETEQRDKAALRRVLVDTYSEKFASDDMVNLISTEMKEAWPHKDKFEILDDAPIFSVDYFYPCPCVIIMSHGIRVTKKSYSNIDGSLANGINGIHIEAAHVLLSLAASRNGIATDSIMRTWKFNLPRKELVPHPWDTWKFIIAWEWSEWEQAHRETGKKVTLKQRWNRMEKCGYPHGQKAFERMHRELFPKK